jgi:tartrate-resistant acid phosphatase type 5
LYYTAGQKDSATAMQKTASDISADFVMAVGDNFYLSGIRSDEFSSRFHDTFENVYEGQGLQVPWLICAGNHDYLGNVTAQIAYSSHSSRWTFPALYYSKSFASEDGVTVDVLMIDTVSLTGAEDSLVEDENDPEYFRPLKEVPAVKMRISGTGWKQLWLRLQRIMYLLEAISRLGCLLV